MIFWRRVAGLCLSLALIPILPLQTAGADSVEVTAESAVLIDADTGQVLYEKNAGDLRHPASMTKVMTGLLTVENSSTDEIVTASSEAVQIPPGSSHVALSAGEQLTVDSALYALMLPSANDAANVLAEHVAGSQSAFVELMNRRAQEIGAVNTTFENPHGYTSDNHLTTAYDMALITREAIANPTFLKYFGTDRHTIPATNLQSEERPFTNQQYMLLPDMWVYNPEVLGGKVGYTHEARHTMTTAARRGDITLIAVVMGCGIDNKFYDTQTLFDYGFDTFSKAAIPPERLTFTTPATDSGEVVGEAVFAPEADAISMLLAPGEDIGNAEYTYNVPELVEADSDIRATVTVHLPGASGASLEIPLTVEFNLAGSPVSAAVTPTTQRPLRSFALPFSYKWLFLLVIIPIGVFGWMIVQREKIRRRAERRRLRQERVLRERRHYGSGV